MSGTTTFDFFKNIVGLGIAYHHVTVTMDKSWLHKAHKDPDATNDRGVATWLEIVVLRSRVTPPMLQDMKREEDSLSRFNTAAVDGRRTPLKQSDRVEQPVRIH